MTKYLAPHARGLSWLWGPAYRGLEFRPTRHRGYFVGWKTRAAKRAGW